MHNSDYMTVLDKHELSSVNGIFESVRHILHHTHSLARVEKKLSRLVPFLNDDFARMRYITFFLERLMPDMGSEWLGGFESPSLDFNKTQPGTRVIESLISLHTGTNISTLLSSDKNNHEVFSALGASTLLHTPLSYKTLFSTAGRSVFIDSLIRQIVRSNMMQYNAASAVAEAGAVLNEYSQQHKSGGSVFNFILDIAAEHRIPVFSESTAAGLLVRHREHSDTTLSLLRYIGESGFQGLLPQLCSMLTDSTVSLPVRYCIVDVVAQLGSEREIDTLTKIKNQAESSLAFDAYKPLAEFIDVSKKELEERNDDSPMAPERATLVQCMFYGDMLLPGQAGGGGLATFLNNLGNSLAAGDDWEAVYSLVLMPVNQTDSPKPFFQQSGDFHFVLRTPVSFIPSHPAVQFAAHEYEIMRSVRRTFERHRVHPDLFHFRYSDNASLGIMTLAKQLGKKAVFTLTPDPHRNFVGRKGTLRSLSEEILIRDMNKVFVADNLVENADGIVLIGHHRKNNQILPYFPQLWLDKDIRKKPLRIMAEGVRTSFSYLDGSSKDSYIDLLLHHGGTYRLSSDMLGNPIILNVGRLDPLKGQHYLVEAWAESKLNEHYCLVLVGGNIENPDPVERAVLERIDRCMASHQHLIGRFCHIPSLPNPMVRLLEQSIIDFITGAYPHVYVCSSFKEEFGISILEGMSSGFLAIAPQNGGVYSYMDNGKTGFLIHTENADTIRTDLEKVLEPAHGSGKRLKSIARHGREMVRDTFNIKRIAGDFSDYYRLFIDG